jgi:hypothetical protein
MPALHELSDKELREKLASGELSDKKALFFGGADKSVFKLGLSVILGWEPSSQRLD